MNSRQTKWLQIQKVTSTGKTFRYEVFTQDGTLLGEIKWYAQWRQYAFFPRPNTLYEKQCLTDISDFCFDLMEERKLAKVPELVNILNQVAAERKRQNVKWGVQDYPSINELIAVAGYRPDRQCEELEIPTENRAKFLCNKGLKDGDVTWGQIVVEELSESVSCIDDVQRRDELIQLAAVVIQWIECIDRNKKNGNT